MPLSTWTYPRIGVPFPLLRRGRSFWRPTIDRAHTYARCRRRQISNAAPPSLASTPQNSSRRGAVPRELESRARSLPARRWTSSFAGSTPSPMARLSGRACCVATARSPSRPALYRCRANRSFGRSAATSWKAFESYRSPNRLLTEVTEAQDRRANTRRRTDRYGPNPRPVCSHIRGERASPPWWEARSGDVARANRLHADVRAFDAKSVVPRPHRAASEASLIGQAGIDTVVDLAAVARLRAIRFVLSRRSQSRCS